MDKYQEFNGRLYETRLTVPAGASRVIEFATTDAASLIVHAIGVGVSATVSLTASPKDELTAGTARFLLAKTMGTDGVITNGSDYSEIVTPLTAIKVEAAGGDVIVEVLQ